MVTELEPLLAPEVMGRKDGDADDNGDPHFTPAMVQLLPGRFKTVRWRWESLCCVFAMVSLGTAPVSQWVPLEPVMVSEGVTMGEGSDSNATIRDLSQAYVIATSVMLISTLPAGLVFDIAGPAACVLIGGGIAAIGISMMALAISRPALNAWLYWAYPVAQVGGNMMGYCLIGWIWLLPEHQNVINSMFAASYSISDSIALIGVVLANNGIKLEDFFFAVAIMAGISGGVAFFVAPSRQEYQLTFEMVKLRQIPTTNKGKRSLRGLCGDALRLTWRQLAAIPAVVRLNPWTCCVFQLYVCAFYTGLLQELGKQYEFLQVVVPKHAVALIDITGIVIAVGGVLVPIILGLVLDRIGIPLAVIGVTCIQVAAQVLQLQSTYACQLAWIVMFPLQFNFCFVLYIRFCQQYAPQEMFGTMSAMIALVVAIPSVTIAPLLQTYLSGKYGTGSRNSYAYGFCAWTALSTMFSLGLCLIWSWHPPPPSGSIVMATNGDIVDSRRTPPPRPATGEAESRGDHMLPIKPLECGASINGEHETQASPAGGDSAV